MEYQRRVVCAANRDEQSQELLLGARHWDELMHDSYHQWLELNGRHWKDGGGYFNEQGFIDQHGVFMDRQEAWKVAEAAGQIIRRVGGDTLDGGTLFSENLY